MKPIEAIATTASASRFSLLFNPVFWIVLMIWTLFVAAYAYDLGREHERHEQQAITVQALEAQAKANGIVLERERNLRTANRKAFDTFKQEQARAEKLSSILIADLRRNTRRLRVPVRSVCPAATDGGGDARSDTSAEGYAELTGDFSARVVELFSRGDEAIRKHSEVVDRYERLRSACTTPINPQPE